MEDCEGDGRASGGVRAPGSYCSVEEAIFMAIIKGMPRYAWQVGLKKSYNGRHCSGRIRANPVLAGAAGLPDNC